jgi:transcription initiation factor TFIID TATA-box-binding protein
MDTQLTETISTENVVASTTVGQELDLDAVSQDLLGVEYKASEFPGVVYRTQQPKAASLIFRSGKIICTGAKNVNAAQGSLESLFDEFRGLGIDVDDPDVSVVNVVSCADLGSPINLSAAAIGLGLEAVEYEPEQFPGLVYRLSELDVVILLFSSGKVVITGATDVSTPPKALEAAHSKLDSLGLLA